MLLATMALSDEDLMLRTGQGDHGAFRVLVDRHQSRAFALAFRITGSRGDAEEAVQEAFVRVWVNAPKWSREGALFRTWFSRILTNLCIDRRRRVKPAPLEAAPEPADERVDAFGDLAAAEEAAAVQRAMSDLPDRQRAALALCYFDGLGQAEAAAALGVSVGALESLLVRGRRALKTALGGRLGRSGEDGQ